MALEKYTTTVVGAYSLPRWYEVLQKQVEARALSMEDMRDAQWRCTQAALVDQETAGIDVVNGGEMHRRQNNRHAPPNAMLNFFWQKIPGFEKAPTAEYGIVTRPRNITPKDEGVFHPAAVCTEKIEYGDLGLVEEFNFVAKYSRDPDNVKVTMTGPHMLAKVAHDEYYGGDLRTMMMDLAEVINQNFKQLEEAGCKHIQLDEPLFAVGGITRDEVEAAIEANNQAWEGVEAFRWQHVCQGNYAVGEDYDGQIGHRYFDVEPYPTEQICSLECDAIMNEGDMTPKYEGLLRNQQLAVGVADVQDLNVEAPDTLVERINEWGGSWLSPEQTLITSSCGMNHLPRPVAFGKLAAMAGARDILRGVLAPV
jgi:5-methyltetrahydropteroyltriglutamate--homocysteine methyltransferase